MSAIQEAPKLTLTLFDFTDPEKPKRVSAVLGYDNSDPLGYGPLKVTIGCGDDVCHSTLTVPLDMLSAGMAQLMQAHQQQKAGGLVGFDKPAIVTN